MSGVRSQPHAWHNTTCIDCGMRLEWPGATQPCTAIYLRQQRRSDRRRAERTREMRREAVVR